MAESKPLNRNDIVTLREAARRNNVDAIKALVKYRFDIALSGLRSSKTDQRYYQGRCDALEEILIDIIDPKRDI